MKPRPSSPLNHFTVPCVIFLVLLSFTFVNAEHIHCTAYPTNGTSRDPCDGVQCGERFGRGQESEIVWGCGGHGRPLLRQRSRYTARSTAAWHTSRPIGI